MEQRQVLGTAGAAWDATAIESSLIMMYGDAHLDDRARMRSVDGGTSTSGHSSRSFRSLSSTSTATSRGRSSVRSGSSRGGRGFRGTFITGITEEEDELGDSEESGEEASPPQSSRSPKPSRESSAVAETPPSAPAASGTLLVDDLEEEGDAKLLLDDSDGLSDLPENEEELLEVYYQGLRAKKKLKGNRTRDKSKSTCKDCKGTGHWAGDAERPMVKRGERAPFKPAAKKKAPEKKAPAKKAAAKKPAAKKPAAKKAPATTKTGRLRASAVRIIKAADS